MTLYTRHQLAVLLILLGAVGLGLAVGHWRRAHPDLVDRLEALDRSRAPVAGSLATGARAQNSRESSAGRRTRAAGSRDPSRACPSAPHLGVPAVVVDATSQTEP
jgi:hypothetical protein